MDKTLLIDQLQKRKELFSKNLLAIIQDAKPGWQESALRLAAKLEVYDEVMALIETL